MQVQSLDELILLKVGRLAPTSESVLSVLPFPWVEIKQSLSRLTDDGQIIPFASGYVRGSRHLVAGYVADEDEDGRGSGR